jgi:bifunctional UDP-N-acetylglucosamine pyrophosphorylase/glucosamine-1-phosphate N-acetyltransferase
VGRGSKVPHVSYLGDTDLGEDANIGAGTITANFDGTNKNRTKIGDGAFVGVDTMLVAPVKLGKGSRTGAGSVVTKDVPDGATAVGVPARVVRRKESSPSPASAGEGRGEGETQNENDR